MSLTERAPVSSSMSNTISRRVTLSGAAYVMPRWRHSSTSYFGGSNSYFTNSSCDELEKSEIGNTDLNTACRPSSGRPPTGSFTSTKLSYEAFCTSLRFGTSATSVIVPKNFLTRLRPVNVCAIFSLSIRLHRAARAPLRTAAFHRDHRDRRRGRPLLCDSVSPNRRTLHAHRDHSLPVHDASGGLPSSWPGSSRPLAIDLN